MSETPAADAAAPKLGRGRMPPLETAEADRLFDEGVTLFNAVRYWHAHEAWETLWRSAPDDERDFHKGLIQVAAGLLHLQRRNPRGARNKLTEGLERLEGYQPTHRGIVVGELVVTARRILDELDAGSLPSLIPPVIRTVDAEPDERDQ